MNRNSLVMLALFVGCGAASAAGMQASGTWARGDGNVRVSVAPCGSNICATNVWVKDTSKGEHVGDKLILTVKEDGENSYSGNAFDPKRNLNLSFRMRVEKGVLTTSGCVVGGLICKSEKWSRVQ